MPINNKSRPVSLLTSFYVLSQRLIRLLTADLWNMLL